MVYTFCKCPAGQDAQYGPIWKAAGIPEHFQHFTLESSPHKLGVHDPADWLYLHGLVGRGKTGLAIGWARKLIWDGFAASALFVKVPRLLHDVKASYGRDKSTEDVLQRYIDTDLLILDDIASVNPSNVEWLTEVMYLIIDSRHDAHRTTLITSNSTLAELASVIGTQNSWRIQEMCGEDGVMVFNGPNLRLKDR